MTSKQTLHNLKAKIDYDIVNEEEFNDALNELKTIEKDLELLEKLKSILKVSEHDDYIGFYTNGYRNNKDILEIKEWLQNDR